MILEWVAQVSLKEVVPAKNLVDDSLGEDTPTLKSVSRSIV